MITSKWFRFIIANIYNILQYVIARILRHMCNLHIKETEISQKRSKGIKNWKITYSVILSVLSSKTNLILGFSSPLTQIFSVQNYQLPFWPILLRILNYYSVLQDILFFLENVLFFLKTPLFPFLEPSWSFTA